MEDGLIFTEEKKYFLSHGGTLVGWLIFLIALFLPANNLFDVNSTILEAFAITFPLVLLFIARALDGVTGGNVSIADAYVADISSDKNRGGNYGKMGMASNLGFVIGPVLAGILSAIVYGEIPPVLVALILSLVILVIIFLALKESKPSIVTQIPEKDKVGKVFAFECKEC